MYFIFVVSKILEAPALGAEAVQIPFLRISILLLCRDAMGNLPLPYSRDYSSLLVRASRSAGQG
jgi:hypothetical protein